MHRNQLLVTNLDSQQVDDVGKWFAAVKALVLARSPERPGRRPWAMSAAAGAPGGAAGSPAAARRPERRRSHGARADRANLRPPLP